MFDRVIYKTIVCRECCLGGDVDFPEEVELWVVVRKEMRGPDFCFFVVVSVSCFLRCKLVAGRAKLQQV